MKHKKILSAILAIIMALSNLSTVFSAEYEEQTVEILENEATLSDSAVEPDYSDIVEENETIEYEISDEENLFDNSETIVDADLTADYTAKYAVDGGYIYFNSSSGSIVDADSSITSAVIPETISGTAVTTIAKSAFVNCTKLTNITIPNSVTSIEQYAFENCSQLTNIIIPSSVTAIKSYAFGRCTNLTDLTISDGVKSLYYDSFFACTSLKSVFLPKSITSVSGSAFRGCSSLTDISIDENNSTYTTQNGIIFSKDLSRLVLYPNGKTEISYQVPNGTTSIGSEAFENCKNLTKVILPDTLTYIGQEAFDYCTNLSEIDIPDSITNIDSWAFSYCDSLINIKLPSSVTYISGYMFYSCSSLTNVELSNKTTYIGAYSFANCEKLESITIPSGVTSIYSTAFIGDMWCTNGLKTVYCYKNTTADDASLYPDGVTLVYLDEAISFDESTGTVTGFNGTTDELDIPNEINGVSVVAIDDYAFYNNTSLKNITIPESVVYIGTYAFSGCESLENVTVSEGTAVLDGTGSLGDYAFYNCESLINVTIPKGISIIGDSVFRNCYFLESVDIPENITAVGDYAFNGCNSLRYLTLPETVTAIGQSAFNSCYNLRSLVIPEGVTEIGEYTFSYCYSLKSITLPSSLESIGEYAFLWCKNLDIITIPNGVKTIDGYAFCQCNGLNSLVIPSSVTSIGNNAFAYIYTDFTMYCYKSSLADNTSLYNSEYTVEILYLDETTAPDDNEADFSDEVFYAVEGGNIYFNPNTGEITDCDAGVTAADIPGTINGVDVTGIGNYAFQTTYGLTEVSIPGSVKIIDTNAFYGCYYLKTVNISKGLETIGEAAFFDCYRLSSINIPEGVTAIENNALSWCSIYSGELNIVFPSTLEYIDYYGLAYSAFESLKFLNKDTEFGNNVFWNTSVGTIYCYEGSTADDSDLYYNTNIVYLDENGDTTTESTTETTTEAETVATPAFKVVGVFGGRSVTFTSETDGAVIYYSSTTSNITTDDIMVENGGTVTYEDYYGTIYARAYYNGVWSDVNKFVLKIPVVNTPTVTASGSTVTIKSTTPSSFICYTTDGTEPVITTDGTATNGTWLRVNGARTNSGTVTAEPGDTVRAVAVRSCFTTSASAAAYVSVSPAAFTVVGAFGGRNVTFTSETSGAKIYYSSTTSSLTTSDTCVSNGETVLFENFYGTIYARAYYNGKWSNVARLILKIPTINTPTITYENGKATIRTTTPSCYIYYTTDGTTPSITNGKKLCSNSYGQVTVSSGTTIKAIAVRSCFTNSEVVEYKVN